MTKSNNDITKPRQVRAATRGTPVLVRLQSDALKALDVYANGSDQPVTRPQAIRAILADWLRTHGFGPAATSVKPTGPATDAVVAMEVAIKVDRTRRKR